MGEISAQLTVVEGHGVKLGQTRAVEVHLEEARAREVVRFHVFGEEARRQAHRFQEVVDGGGGGGVGEG